MTEKFVLPKMWRIKTKSKEEQDVINLYARSIGGSHWSNSANYAKNFYLCVTGKKYDLGTNQPSIIANYTEITFEEFQEYVLGGTKKQVINDGKTELQRFNELIQAIKSK